MGEKEIIAREEAMADDDHPLKGPEGPTRKIRLAPPPPTELNSCASPPAPLLGAPVFNRVSTLYLPDDLRSAVDMARIGADQKFRTAIQKAISEGGVDKHLRLDWFWEVFLGFAAAARDMVLRGTWKAGEFADMCEEFFQKTAIMAGMEWHLPSVDAALKNSPEWRRFEEIHTEMVRAQANRAELKAEGVIPGVIELNPSMRPGRPRSTPNLHPEVEQYLDRVSEKATRRITIQDFCLVAGFGDDTFFGFWRRGNNRCPEAHANRFKKTLAMSPEQFLAELAKKRP
jgi:hypothetical protein